MCLILVPVSNFQKCRLRINKRYIQAQNRKSVRMTRLLEVSYFHRTARIFFLEEFVYLSEPKTFPTPDILTFQNSITVSQIKSAEIPGAKMLGDWD